MAQFKRVYLVDDDNVFNLIHSKLIGKLDFAGEVIAYDNAKDALEALVKAESSGAASLPELIFLDINMPVMDGWEFLDKLSIFPAQVFDKCKVIVLSSSIDMNDIEKSKSYKMVVDFISKPLTATKLQAATALLNEYVI